MHRDLNQGDVLPASLLDALQEFVGSADTNLQLTIANPTTVRAVADTGAGQSSFGINGLWRWRTANHDVAVSGAAGTRDVFAVASANSFTSADIDNTDYNWYLQVVASGATPTGNTPAGNPIVAYRKVGQLAWDGAAITSLVGINHLTGPQLAALVGTSGAPDTANRFVTSADARMSDLRNPLAHAASHASGGSDYIKGVVPIGGQIPYTGSGDPPEGEWVIADGRLIDRTTYATYFARTGHVYNGGVDPLGNKVKIPDKRGRKSIGAASMGTDGLNGVVALAFPPGPSPPKNIARVNVARGAVGGESEHTLATTELPSHGHLVTDPGHAHNSSMYYQGTGTAGSINNAGGGAYPLDTNGATAATPVGGTGISVQATGSGVPHTNVDPYEADCYIVRIA